VKQLQTVNNQSLTIDIRKRAISSTFVEKSSMNHPIPQFVQGDTNIIEAVIKDNGEDADLSVVGKVVGNFKRQDNVVVSRSAVVSGNVVTYTLGNEEMLKAGIGELELQFFNTDESERLSSLRFKVNVTPEIGFGLEGTDGPTLAQELIVNGQYAEEQANIAKQSAEEAIAAKESSITTWLSPVADYTAVTSIASPQHGYTVQTNDTGYVYRYENGSWKNTQQYGATSLANVNARLAEKVSQGDTGVITYAMASQDFREQITGGNTAVVGVDAVLEENLTNGAVSPKKTSFLTDYNLLDDSTSLHGGFWQTVGGTWQARVGVSQSQKYPITTGEKIIFNQISPEGNNVVQFWDSADNYLGNYVRTLEHTITVQNVSFFSFSYHDSEIGELEVYKNQIQNPTLKNVDVVRSLSEEETSTLSSNPWINKKVIYQGDSITDPTYNSALSSFYPTIVNSKLKLIQTANYGISGSTIAINPSDATGRNPIISRYSTMSDDADIVIIAAGTNDWYYSWSPLGTMVSRDNQTFYGALHNLCLGLSKKYKGKTILFMTPIMRRQGVLNTPTSTNSNGKTLKEYGEIIKEVCSYYSIPVLDMYKESGLYPFDDELAIEYFNKQGTSPDYYYTHPNSNGHKMMGKRLTGYLRQLA
jgi:lysophospholipase L1-like esterase